MDPVKVKQELLLINQRLLDSMVSQDWNLYKHLVHPNFTCIEPETENCIYEGLELHKTFFDAKRNPNEEQKEIVLNPCIKIYGDTAIMCYKRVRQITNYETFDVRNVSFAETRVWKKNEEGEWKLLHFHKS